VRKGVKGGELYKSFLVRCKGGGKRWDFIECKGSRGRGGAG